MFFSINFLIRLENIQKKKFFFFMTKLLFVGFFFRVFKGIVFELHQTGSRIFIV